MTSQDPGDEPQIKKKRGGQPGNTNALKHGFYSRRFRAIELEDLDAIGQDLESEIALLRVSLRRVFEFINDKDFEIDQAISNLHSLGLGATRIATLMRTQAILVGNRPGVVESLSDVLDHVLKEMGRI